jgi:hypothetical protein
VGFEQMMTLDPKERVGDLAVAAADDLGHGDLGVVVADPPGHAAEEGEGADVSLQERLSALAREGAAEGGIRVRHGHDEQGDFGRRPVERDLRLAEVDLGLAGSVGQRDEDLGAGAPPGADGVLDDGQTSGVAVLVAEPLEDAPGGVALLPGGLLVVLEDLVDDGEEGIELGPGSRGRAAVAGRLGMVEDLLEGVPVDVELAADGALALFVDEDAAADLGPVLHVGEHP